MFSAFCLTIERCHHNSVLSVGIECRRRYERVHLRSSRLQIVYGQRLVLQVCNHAHDMQHTQLVDVMTRL